MNGTIIGWMVVGIAIGGTTPLRAQTANREPRSLALPSLPPSGSQTAQKSVKQSKRQAVQPQNQDRLVTLFVRDSTLAYVVRAITSQANLQVVYDNADQKFTRRVTVQLSKTPMMEALTVALKGTGLVATLTPKGETVVIRSQSDRGQSRTDANDSTQQKNRGAVTGRVVDSVTKKGLAGVTVLVAGTKTVATSREDGSFRLEEVTAGAQSLSVRLLGYNSRTVAVTVESNKVAQTTVALLQSATTLTEIVTTAMGLQRRVDISNDVVKIDAQKLIETAPVRNVTDILIAAQVRGMTITPSSGEPGAPARIRIGGVGSISQNNDPVVIVDGVWIRSGFSDSTIRRQLEGGGSGMLPSRLDALDPSTIESIEIVRGPSAAALYGPDAANGVISITTKRGRAGPARWDVRVYRDWSTPVGQLPATYIAYGRGAFSTEPIECPLASLMVNMCSQDSIVVTYPGRRFLRNEGNSFINGLSTTVSGGSNQLMYSLTGSAQDQEGVRKLSEVNRVRLRQLNYPVSSQMKNPSFLSNRSVSARLVMTPSDRLNLSVNLDGSQSNGRENDITLTRGPFVFFSPADTLTTLIGSAKITPKNSRTTTTRGLLSLTANWNPNSWWTGTMTAGVDRGFTDERSSGVVKLCVDGACNDAESPTGNASRKYSVYTMRAQSTFSPSLGALSRFLSVRPGVSIDMQRDVQSSLSAMKIVYAGGTPYSDVNQTLGPTTALAGIGFNAYIRLFDRISFDPGFRRDFGTSKALKNNAKTYPRFGTSWLVSDESFFPKNPWVTMVRLRGALGYAAVQPDISALQGRYFAGKTVVNNQTVSTINFQAVGNNELEPERSFEIETGFDADLLGDRFTLTVTHSNKRNMSTLINRTLAPSAGASGTRQENVARIINRNTNVELSGLVIDRSGLTVRGGVGLSVLDNRVKTLGSGVSPFGPNEQRYVAGYPVGGLWVRPVLLINDANKNGLLEQGEYVIGDTAVYAGSNIPRYSAGYRLEIGLLNQFSVNALFNYKGSYMQNRSTFSASSRGSWDPSAPLSEQAVVLIIGQAGGSDRQNISELRFQSGSVTYNVPAQAARRLKARSLQVSVQGNNLGLWTRYRGRDPGVNSTPIGERTTDGNFLSSVIPEPRSYALQFRLGF